MVWRRVRFALAPKDYLAYRLTGDIGTDPTGPTRSLLNDWRHQDWSVATCAEAGIPREILPDVKYRPWKPRGTLGPLPDLGLVPGTTLTEYLDALRALLAGQAVTTSGRYVTLTDVRLAHPPAIAPLVLAGVRGPKSLAVAGRHADGTILAEPVTPAYVEFARSHIGGAGEHHIVAYNVAAVDDDLVMGPVGDDPIGEISQLARVLERA